MPDNQPLNAVRTALNVARKPLNVARTTLKASQAPLNVERSAVNAAKLALKVARTPLDAAQAPVKAGKIALNGQRSAINIARAVLKVGRTMLEAWRALLDAAKSALDSVRAKIKNPRIMNRYQLNLTDMFATVSAYMAKNKTIWQGVPAILATVSDLDTGLGVIGETDKKQASPTSGATKDKEQVRHDYEEEILLIADQLAALAAQTKNAVLAGKAELTLSSLNKMPAEVLEATGKNISELATANIAALAGYNITAADVTALDNLTTAFHGAKSEPRAAVVDRKKQTDTLPGAIADVRSILRNRLDKQMTTYRRTNGEFYAGYLAARVIVDKGGGGKKPTPPPAKPQ